MDRSQTIKAYLKPKKVLGYMFMPRVIPRIKELFGSGFGWIAMLMALIYQSVRLLPPGHPYTNPANKGRFGIRHVIAEAANNLIIKKENTDQIAIFVILLLGLVILALQILFLIIGFVIQPALAFNPGGIPGFVGLFATPNPTNDIAFMLLDRVFGIPDMFGSQFNPAAGAIPPFQQAMHTLFSYYSTMILIVGVFVFLYYVVVTLGETVTTGTPFGKRFNTIWAPLRLVVAVGLLVPMNHGLNSAQYITLYAAKFGSSFATNGWILFANNLANPTDLQNESLLARPTVPDVKHIVKFMMVVQACRNAYEELYDGSDNTMDIDIEMFYVKNPLTAQQVPTPADWQAAVDFYDNEDIIIRFGHEDANEYPLSRGGVFPFCGEITIHTTSNDGQNGITTGAEDIQQQYLRMITFLWERDVMQDFGRRAVRTFMTIEDIGQPCGVTFPQEPSCDNQNAKLPPEAFKAAEYGQAQGLFLGQVVSAYDQSVNGAYAPSYAVPQELLDRGWGGAAIWYNKIAEWNGAFTAAAINVPTPSKMPMVMEKTQDERSSHDETVDAENRFNPYLSNGTPIKFSLTGELGIADMLNKVYKYWEKGDDGEFSDMQQSQNIIISAIQMTFGLNGLFDMRDNADTHPLAALVGTGKAIIESAIRNLMIGLGFAFVGGVTTALEPHIGQFLSGISSLFVSFATIGITVGFVLYYVLPFIPFMYMFFAVGGWVKSIFEALVGVPLWALAHLRVDGNGLPGDTASNGYFLIFEIFVRPILTIFGLLGGMVIFSALMRTLQGIFPLVIANLTGFDANIDPAVGSIVGIEYKRDAVDEFMFTIIYTIVAYIIATSSFKMIDQVPNGILRWMGAGVQSFSDQRDDPAQGLVQYAGIGGYQMSTQITGAFAQGTEGAGRAAGQALFGLGTRLTGK